MSRRRTAVAVTVVAVLGAVFVSRAYATDHTLLANPETVRRQAIHVYALGQVRSRPWLTRLAGGSLGLAAGLVAGGVGAFAYHSRRMR